MNAAASTAASGQPTLVRRTSGPWFGVLLFVAVATCLIAANWTHIAARNLEFNDFAANSILVQDAKAGHLLVGNYSRVGFNHPGPAILDVLAAGEAVFFDGLHWVPSPLSGQLVAVGLYNAFWIVLIVRLWGRLARRRRVTVIGAIIFLVATALLDVRFFTGPWFPHLYYFPFATYLFAVATLATGRSRGLTSLALSLGFLINGHVAFVSITAVVLSIALVANWRAFGRIDRDRAVVDSRWLKAHRGPVLIGTTIVAVFLVPLALETIARFPGPIGDYLRFSGNHRPNTPIASLRFMAMYWGGLPFLVLPALFVALASRFEFEDAEWSRSVHAVLATALGASVGVLFYACFGVDQLYAAYIGFFYCAVIALVPMLAVSFAVESTAFRKHGRWTLAIGLIVFAVACFKLKREDDYTASYRAPEIATLHQELRAMARQGRIVIDLPEPDFTDTWPVVAGIEVDARRQGEDLLCIAQNWHILFSTRTRCTAEEVSQHEHLVVTKTSTDGSLRGKPVLQGMDVAFHRLEP